VLKNVAFVIVAGSLAFAAQAVLADDTQFDIGGGKYQGVSALPFPAAPSGAMAGRDVVTPAAAQGLDRTQTTSPATKTSTPTAPYNVEGGYFN
jgi:hypothetical protein